jgi:hypothetical protein
MLSPSDLKHYLNIYKAALGSAVSGPCRAADVVLADPASTIDEREIWYLARAVRIAAHMGEAAFEAAAALGRIKSVLGDGRVAPLTSSAPWQEAVRWALRDLKAVPDYGSSLAPREEAVANACLRLRKEGYEIKVDAGGPRINPRSRAEIARRIETLVAVVGGRNTLEQLFRILRETHRLHDGYWLFGNHVARVGQTKSPSLPFGWLIALALKHTRKSGRLANPAKAWANLTQLATDLAACFDVERYGQFEGIDLRPADLPYLFSESVGWSQLFTQPQSPTAIVPAMRQVLRDLLDQSDLRALGLDFWDLLAELETLLRSCNSDRLTILGRDQAAQHFPTLIGSIEGFSNQVNAGFADPFDAGALDHFQRVLFDGGADGFLVLPRALASAAAATLIVHRLWNRLDGDRASELTGKLFEAMIAQACRAKTGKVSADLHYHFKGKSLQIDVAVIEPEALILFEVKSKSLTLRARSGELIKTLDDYGNSYLALVLQLARHENAIRSGSTELLDATGGNDVEFTNVAVSPLTLGPMTDRALARPLLSALAVARISPTNADPEASRIVAKLEKAISNLLEEVQPLALNAKGELDFHTFLMNFFWLDLGEILYMLSRSSDVASAFRPLRYLSFVSRDFWTEVAFADRSGLTSRYWRPPTA